MSAVLEQAPQFTTDDVIRRYIDLRDTIDQINNEAKARVKAIEADMEKLAAYLHKQLIESGEQSRGTDAGTVYRETVTFAKTKNWDQTLDFIRTNNAWHFLKKDINKTAVKEYVEEHKVPPPGVDWVEKEEVKIRKK